MWRLWIRGVFLGLIAGSWELVIRPFLPGFMACSLTVPLLVLAVVRHRTAQTIFARLCGILMIEWSFSFAIGYESLRWIVVAFLLYVVFEKLITNASLVAVICATIIARLGEQFFLRLLDLVSHFFGSTQGGIHEQLLPIILWDVAIAISVYVFFTWFSQDRGKVMKHQQDGWML